MPGIDPGASEMRTRRDTIFTTPPTDVAALAAESIWLGPSYDERQVVGHPVHSKRRDVSNLATSLSR
eukprot:1318876-Amorphochlora_amoeboformis.AAC.1